MPLPPVNDRIKEIPAQALRAVFAFPSPAHSSIALAKTPRELNSINAVLRSSASITPLTAFPLASTAW